MTLVPGQRLVIRRVASTPLSPGSLTSISTTSGAGPGDLSPWYATERGMGFYA